MHYDPDTDRMGLLYRSSATGVLAEIITETLTYVTLALVYEAGTITVPWSTFDRHMVRERDGVK